MTASLTMTDTSRTVFFAGGGTGGHLQPNVLLKRILERRHEDWRFVFLVSGRPVERQFLSDRDVVVPLFPGRGSRPSLLRPDVYLRAIWKVRELLREHRPDLLVYGGGYVSALAGAVAGRTPSVVLQPDRIPGKATRFLGRGARRIFSQWEGARETDPTSSTIVSGMPLPFQEFPSKREARRQLKLGDRKTLLIVGGSQGARAINRLFADQADQLDRSVQVIHVTGAADRPWVEEAWKTSGITALVTPFREDMVTLYSAADLVVARAGGMTVAEIAAVGRPAIFIPYPHHKDRHQFANAEMLCQARAAWIWEENAESRDFVGRQVMGCLRNGKELEQRADRARGLGRRDAGEFIAEEIEALLSYPAGDCVTAGSWAGSASKGETRAWEAAGGGTT